MSAKMLFHLGCIKNTKNNKNKTDKSIEKRQEFVISTSQNKIPNN